MKKTSIGKKILYIVTAIYFVFLIAFFVCMLMAVSVPEFFSSIAGAGFLLLLVVYTFVFVESMKDKESLKNIRQIRRIVL